LISRRQFLQAALAGAAVGPWASAKTAPGGLSVGVVGAGLAGLSCAYELKRAGISAVVYEASDHVGGRCLSMPFHNRVIERGGELIDTSHKSMLGYAREFGLTVESLRKLPGETFYYFGGQRYSEAAIVEELRAFVPAMREDLRRLSPAPSADTHTTEDILLDNTSLADYLYSRQAGPELYKALEQAYIAEYGRELSEQSCLNFLLFMRANRRSRFQPFGTSDERYHIIEGNQSVPIGLARRLAGQVQYGLTVVRVSKTSAGTIQLDFANGVSRNHDVVVLTTPFTALRSIVQLHPSLSLPPWKQAAIQQLGYGTNTKMMVGFEARPWTALGSDGSSYSDLPHHQNTWETNPTISAAGAILTDYSGGIRGASLNPANPQFEVGRWLSDLDLVYPGAINGATRQGGQYLVHLEHWPSNPLTQGSYTCYKPGQFTSLAGNEGKPVGNLLFAGEHANSFYEFQGFMEGALLSGVAAAKEILRPDK
jgi:monoamine oxidase